LSLVVKTRIEKAAQAMIQALDTFDYHEIRWESAQQCEHYSSQLFHTLFAANLHEGKKDNDVQPRHMQTKQGPRVSRLASTLSNTIDKAMDMNPAPIHEITYNSKKQIQISMLRNRIIHYYARNGNVGDIPLDIVRM
jgi:hypothetical protein